MPCGMRSDATACHVSATQRHKIESTARVGNGLRYRFLGLACSVGRLTPDGGLS
jgi:hypothetical protein